MLKKRLEALESSHHADPLSAFNDVPLSKLLELGSSCGDIEELPAWEDILRGLFTAPSAQTEYLPLALCLFRRGMDSRAAIFVADAIEGNATADRAKEFQEHTGLPRT